jgi:hypothetical protein
MNHFDKAVLILQLAYINQYFWRYAVGEKMDARPQ